MKRLNKGNVLLLHKQLIEKTGGLDGLRDEGLLESALNAPFQTIGGMYAYPSLEQKAARLGFSIIMNHPFIDGNKRVGILVMLTFLELNGVHLACTDEELIDIGLNLVDGSFDDKALFKWILNHVDDADYQ